MIDPRCLFSRITTIWNWRQVCSNWPANSQDNDWLDHFCPGMNFHGPGGHIFPKWALKPLWVNPICLEILKIYLSCKRNMELTFEVCSNWLINSWDMERAILGGPEPLPGPPGTPAHQPKCAPMSKFFPRVPSSYSKWENSGHFDCKRLYRPAPWLIGHFEVSDQILTEFWLHTLSLSP